MAIREEIRDEGMRTLLEAVAPIETWIAFDEVFRELAERAAVRGIRPETFMIMLAWRAGHGIAGQESRCPDNQDWFDDALLNAVDMVKWGAEFGGMDTAEWFERVSKKWEQQISVSETGEKP